MGDRLILERPDDVDERLAAGQLGQELRRRVLGRC